MNRPALVFLTIFTLISHSSAFAQQRLSPEPEAKVRWAENIRDAIQQHRETGRPLVVYFTADHCGYCRKMDRDTWSNPDVVLRIQDGFVAWKVNAEQHPELVKRFGVEGFPTTIVFSSARQRVQTIVGYSRSGAMVELLDSVPATPSVAFGAAATPR